MRFRSKVLASGKNTTGIPVPAEVVESLGGGKRPKVQVGFRDYSYRTSVASMGGEYMLSVSKAVRDESGVAAGDELDVDIELDTKPRDVEVPADLAKALASEPTARSFFEGLSYSKKRGFVDWMEQAKKAETREGRVAKAVEMLREGRSR